MTTTMPTTIAVPDTSTSQILPADTRLGAVHIGVTDGERARIFWTQAVGLTLLADDGDTIRLGAGERELVVLHTGATSPVLRGRTGLYHVALHLPTRKDLAIATARLFALRVPNSPTDHTVTETTYLSDPDGNGIELTFETPDRGEFVIVNGRYMARMADGTVREGNAAVDLDSLFGELAETDDLAAPMPAGTRIGHVHLHVADLTAADDFYRNLIGFAPFMSMPSIQMADYSLSTTRAPHALALNTWQGRQAQPAPADASGLRHVTIEVPSPADLEPIAQRLTQANWPFERDDAGLRVLDPAKNALHIVAAS